MSGHSQSKPACPHCGKAGALERLRTDLGVLWACPVCKGRAVTFPLLKKQVDRTFMNHLWQQILDADARGHGSGRLCPGCSRPMVHFACHGIAEPFQLDACRVCQFLWFDTDEVLHLPISPPGPKQQESALSPEAREALALAKVEMLAERARKEQRRDDGAELWSLLLRMLTLRF